ncbi:MAG: DNA polymerase IV [Bacteroidales bacterium]|nr:DNA polymerase IV [Bacteroidales bacterium]
MPVRKIIHVDMDAFYASIEQRDHPELRGKPIAVGYDGPRGVVSTASYEARRYGVHSALSSVLARRLCPDLIFMPARFDVYKSVSRQIHDIFHEYTELVEPLSLDEAFLDVSAACSATLLAREIKARIRETTGLTASAGVSVNKMLAKIASDYRKPDGLFVIPPKDVEEFVAGLPVEKFFGIGKVTAERMHNLGIHLGSDLRKWSEEALVRQFGKTGRIYYGYARGIDERPVEAHRIRKSLGAEETFAEDTNDPRRLAAELAAICGEVWKRMTRHRFNGKTVILKVKFEDFRQITRSRTLPANVGSQELLQKITGELLGTVDFKERKIRLIGVTVSNAADIQETTGMAGMQLRIDFGEDGEF